MDDGLKYGDYKIFCSLLHEMNKIQIKDHNIRNNRINKIFLSWYNNKKHVLEDGHSRLLHLHECTR